MPQDDIQFIQMFDLNLGFVVSVDVTFPTARHIRVRGPDASATAVQRRQQNHFVANRERLYCLPSLTFSSPNS